MQKSTIARSWGLRWCLAACASWGAMSRVDAQDQPLPPPANLAPAIGDDSVVVTATRTNIEIAERFAKVVRLPAAIKRIDGFDETVVKVTPLSPTEIRVQAVEQGVTTIVFTAKDEKAYQVEVFVTGDSRLLSAVLKRHFPNTAVNVIKVRDSVVLRGWVSEPHQITEIVEFARVYHPEVINQMKVGGPQEVQLRVKVMEVQRSLVRRFGINFTAGGNSAAFGSTPGPIAGLQTLTVPFGGPPDISLAGSQLSNASMALGIATNDFVFAGLIQALKEEGLLKIQAEPVIVTRSGEAARLVNGGEFPIPVPQSLGTVTIEWREFGVVLESLPMVLGPTTLKQTIVAEVSERDFSTAVTLNGTTVPGLTKRTLQTQAVMEFGQTLVIGGLITTRTTAETDKIPVLGELPGVGAAFRRTRYDMAETELLVLITPEYVSGMSPDQVPPGGPGRGTAPPVDRELYWDGVIEVPNYGEPCDGCQPGAGLVSGGGYSAPAMAPATLATDPALTPTLNAIPPSPPSTTVKERPVSPIQPVSGASTNPDSGLFEP